MNYLSIENVSKAFGERVLFENLSFGINKDQKIAFVAKNGTGKTRLLEIIAGNDVPDTGQVVTRKDLHVSYLSQEDAFDENQTVEEVIFDSDSKVLKIVQEYEKAIENPEDAERYQLAFDMMDQYNAWDFETQYKQILSKLKLDNLQLKVSGLSGGQRKRLALATVLISKPDLLILDEPTNHLDLEMIEWLESFFAKEKITLFMVTHDRYFLERVCNEIIEMDNGQLYSYKGNYSYYLEKKEERIELEQTVQAKAKNLFKKELDWMRRQPKARTTKSKSRIDDFFVIKEKARARRAEHKVQLEINMERLGNKIVEFHKVSKAWEDMVMLDQFDYNFGRGERIGIIGKNGTGKSSFLNVLTGNTEVDSGKVVVGETIKFGYYHQSGIQVKEGQKVIEVIKEFGEFIPLAKGHKISASQLLERFLFDKKKQYDFVEKLSGGERKRLYLCTVLIQNPNFLILDEPTNDLDIVTLNVLESFMLDYPGNLVVVSHDRYFMDKIVDSLFVFRGNGVIENFPGNYSDFRAYENSDNQEEQEIVPTKIETVKEKQKTPAKLSYAENKEYINLESDIAKLNRKKEAIEAEFAEGKIEGEAIDKKSIELQKIIDDIEFKEMRWFELSEKLEG
ncbi:ABC-F family ATP-binding cassette domain-containing protein [Wenyingzhuangia marina]|uniref:ATP-binding cassette, subfamily F, uup n=1 Tax=Wenyingzhuangia marina TaxID=1195760 RepID=A0A1M5SLL0_9FLAO|nr:ABC-F family ATP-binding cassette domain-containing protein [Wenyingzhuangia marina]GGF62791.1 ABC transporter [Wenyingzhuangia marina]SHH39290.1 ATP-binding cassette, subfamily F, uup [Wenyingzhuangia marina]